MNDCLFPEFLFITLAEHVVDTDLISLDPITSSSMDTEAFLLLDPLALLVSLEEPYSSVRPDPKSYPWLLEARQVHIALLLVVMVENITDDALEEVVTADLGYGPGSLKVGWFGMPLTLETASEGLIEVVYLLTSLTIESGLIIVNVGHLSPRKLIVVVLIQVVIDPALDILPRLSRGLLHTEVELGYAEILY